MMYHFLLNNDYLIKLNFIFNFFQIKGVLGFWGFEVDCFYFIHFILYLALEADVNGRIIA